MLTSKDFRDQAINLIKKWNNIIDEIPWQWNQINELNNESKGYFTTKRYHKINNNNNNNNNNNIENKNNNNIENFEEIKETIDDSSTTIIKSNNNNNENNIIIFQFDIIYSKSYQVPVLYLNGFSSFDSSPLSWNEIWNNLPLSNLDKNQQSTIPYITQVEHPILGNPCYQLHPCETDNLMKLILLKEKDYNDNNDKKEYFKDYYLLSWLSIIGPMVNIKIPFDLLKNNNI
ncbi:autophagy protein 10 [Dictyostelium discoideum AX4]|uniref:Ubiquitin-like-conjugating enzyme ATG10 n=1 Tax=Dictyostelium discoideum TaxID=44689 RepID=ATG10_DICDI|nr:autophagy protein 10 [Dictyostelium discoideum AX4]Q55EL2.1 RecName: Full=Ubiquitin-like-conjugating enzyme ATG10; AltName: Full=Autophagy-related protein 10 [Dictyostelium discoideum]EAL73009.1 autophagy protein 10 [Dictyostelium discoideum AX4]|eukprot:XP_647008.1 autophagy protein 10 [Dictyostelium discoideum AX4]